MLGYIVQILIVFFSLKMCVSLNPQFPVMMEHKISLTRARFLQFSPLLYVISLGAFVIPHPWLNILAPVPFGLMLLVPGIVLGKKCADILDRSGTDRTNNAKNISSNIFWLGIATLIFILANIALSLFPWVFHSVLQD